MDIRKLKKIDELIRSKKTGNAKELAAKIHCSERMVFKYLKFMREELKAPIALNRNRDFYYYEKEGKVCLEGFLLEDNS